VSLSVYFEALFFNMMKAKADYLFTLDEWKEILSEEKRQEIADLYRRSRTVVKEKTPGRNDPCPCGSGKKFKKCCGATQ
jgi:SWIM/SEC-C metal-binding protein